MGPTSPPWPLEELNVNFLCPAKAKQEYMDTPKNACPQRQQAS